MQFAAVFSSEGKAITSVAKAEEMVKAGVAKFSGSFSYRSTEVFEYMVVGAR